MTAKYKPSQMWYNATTSRVRIHSGHRFRRLNVVHRRPNGLSHYKTSSGRPLLVAVISFHSPSCVYSFSAGARYIMAFGLLRHILGLDHSSHHHMSALSESRLSSIARVERCVSSHRLSRGSMGWRTSRDGKVASTSWILIISSAGKMTLQHKADLGL